MNLGTGISRKDVVSQTPTIIWSYIIILSGQILTKNLSQSPNQSIVCICVSIQEIDILCIMFYEGNINTKAEILYIYNFQSAIY